jgi:hypothetical protein
MGDGVATQGHRPSTRSDGKRSADSLAVLSGRALCNRLGRRIVSVTMKLAAITSLCVLVTACATPSPRPALGVANGTPLTVVVFVNDHQIAAFPPGGPNPTINVATLPSLPWTVDARSQSGRLLTSMHVGPGDVWSSVGPNGDGTYTGTMGRVDLSCGRITIWAGDMTPSGPIPGPGKPGDCVP